MTVSPNRSREIVVQALVIIVVLAVAYAALSAMGAFTPRVEGDREVTYIVRGSATSSVVSYTQADGRASKPETVGVPWRKTVIIPATTDVYLTATNPSQSGNIECVLLLDGEDWKSAIAKLPADKVACAGIVP